jgi:hypothetical protein
MGRRKFSASSTEMIGAGNVFRPEKGRLGQQGVIPNRFFQE